MYNDNNNNITNANNNENDNKINGNSDNIEAATLATIQTDKNKLRYSEIHIYELVRSDSLHAQSAQIPQK